MTAPVVSISVYSSERRVNRRWKTRQCRSVQAPQVRPELMHENDRVAPTVFLKMELYSIRLYARHRYSRDSASWWSVGEHAARRRPYGRAGTKTGVSIIMELDFDMHPYRMTGARRFISDVRLRVAQTRRWTDAEILYCGGGRSGSQGRLHFLRIPIGKAPDGQSCGG